MKATYHKKIFDYNVGLIPRYVRVDVVGESDKSYRIKYMWDGKLVTHLARKRNVKLDNPQPVTRLPYKD